MSELDFGLSMAFQPIVDLENDTVFAHEALVRGEEGEPAGAIFERVDESNLYRFDQTCRVRAIELAARLEVPARLSINFMPNAVYRPEACIQTTLSAAAEFGLPLDRIIFEVTEAEKVVDQEHLRNIMLHYQQRGFLTAIDDFGAGYAGLNLLADFVPDFVKLDMLLVRDVHQDRTRQAIVRGLMGMFHELDVGVIAEGVETRDELDCLADLGVHLFQGFLFARPGFESLPEVNYPD
ncbi:EAL domain-containing protein [Wenzhouxiangella sp. AB-CW3]|uniref:EAL domain-containing protein n=1 Tax=Wenzhouxiangella sp. AB-CW3 TaxID=2771012 RepID=UPI001CC3132C|nr:EAL domain-containing protein [Wenzhouxiangella sp. AB-CW3]